jgi:hypothetical protein
MGCKGTEKKNEKRENEDRNEVGYENWNWKDRTHCKGNTHQKNGRQVPTSQIVSLCVWDKWWQMIMGMVRDGDDSRMTRMTRMTVMLQEVATSDSCSMQPRSVWVLFLEIVRIICIQNNQSQGLRNAKGRKIMKKNENSNMFRYKCSENVPVLSTFKIWVPERYTPRQVQNAPHTAPRRCCHGHHQGAHVLLRTAAIAVSLGEVSLGTWNDAISRAGPHCWSHYRVEE